ncbi:reverse transcriptase domain-containing protein [Tanacetum coccineum]
MILEKVNNNVGELVVVTTRYLHILLWSFAIYTSSGNTVTTAVTFDLNFRPSEEAPRGDGGQSVNLPLLLAAHLGRGENGQPLQPSLTSAYGGQTLPNNIGGNLPSNGTFLSHHAQPFIPISLNIPNGFMPTHIHPYQQPMSYVNWQHLSFPMQTLPGNLPIGGILAHLPQGGHAPQTFANSNMPSQNGFTYPANMPTNSYPFYTQPMYTFPNVPAYTKPNLAGASLNLVGSVTPFVCWIEDYPPHPDRLKMPSYIGSYDGKGHPDSFLHIFEGAIRMQKWLMPVACHMFTYTLKDSARIWWNNKKAGNILDYEDLKAKFQSHFSQQKKFTKPLKKRPANHGGIGEITFPPLPNVGSSDPVIIKVYISGRQVNRAYLDGGSSCDVIYKHCFLKLKPLMRSIRVDSNTSLVGFSGEKSWPLGEIHLEVTIREGPVAVTKTLTFVIVKSDSPHNLLLGRTAIQQIGIVVFIVHGAIKFHTPRVKKKKRSLAAERNEAIHSQVEELTKAGILREVKYQTWVSNPMAVKKDNGKWKLRVDFTNINKACIREPHPLSAAEQKADGLQKYRLKCFLDAYKGYH